MRVVLCLALLVTAATPALAQDRYGPEPSALRAVSAPADMAGQRLLTWANKTDPATLAGASAPAPQQRSAYPAQRSPDTYSPQPQAVAQPQVENAPWRRLTGVSQQPQAQAQPVPQIAPRPTAVAQPVSPARQAVADKAPPIENAPWRRLTGVPQAPQVATQSVATFQPTPAPTRPAQAVQAQGQANRPQAMANHTPTSRPTAPVSQAKALPPVLAGGPPAPASAPSATPDYRTEVAASSAAPPQGEQARYYSLHRDYGETPDPIAMPQKTQVFLAAVPLSSLDLPDNQDADTGQTAAMNKARVAADWGAADDPSTSTSRRVQITRP